MQCYNCDSTHIKYDKSSDSYVCLNCGHVYPKEYWFISHSHLDIEKVRIVRNVIEEVFFYEPILFFLKCLSDDNEITNLIEREISERVWFVYCQSENAANSIYVQQERRYLDDLIAKGHKKKKISINLDNYELWDPFCEKDIREQVFASIRKSKVYVAHAHGDNDSVAGVVDYLTSMGYPTAYMMQETNLFFESVADMMKRFAQEDGVILAFVSEKSLRNEFFRREIELALSELLTVIPVIIDDGNADDLRRRFIEQIPQLARNHYVYFGVKKPDEFYHKLNNLLKYFYYLATPNDK